jgi:hypothetical protein
MQFCNVFQKMLPLLRRHRHGDSAIVDISEQRIGESTNL